MAFESLQRFFNPTSIAYNQAILVAALGLVVNGISVLILGRSEHSHDHAEPGQERTTTMTRITTMRRASTRERPSIPCASHQDHNLRSAYLHVLADALTSVLAIAALLAAKYFGFSWADPAVGVVGAILVARWAVGLLRASSDVLLDRQGPAHVVETVISIIEGDGDSRVADLHLWSIGPGIYAAIIQVVAHNPAPPEEYKARIPQHLRLAHVSIEVCACAVDSALCECAPASASAQGNRGVGASTPV